MSSPSPMQGQRVPVAPQRNPTAIAIATAVRNNKLLKQRQGINVQNSEKQDFFRYKRFVRALESDDYSKRSSKKPEVLPPVTNDQDAQKVFIMMIQNQLVVPVRKLKTKEAKDRGVKVTRTTPALEIINKAVLQPDVYFLWNFNPPNPYLWIYSFIGLVFVFTVVLFPLWPIWMRNSVWYLSTGLLVLIALFFGIAIVRLVIYLVSMVALPRRFWLYPNLFADCGVIESFQPLYEWEEPNSGKKKHGKKKVVAEKSATESSTTATGSATTATSPRKRVATVEEVEDDGE